MPVKNEAHSKVNFWCAQLMSVHYMLCIMLNVCGWLFCFIHIPTLQDIVINFSLQIRILRYGNIFAIVWYLLNIKLSEVKQ